MPSIGPMELIVVLVLALVVLGPKRLPDAGRSLGRGLREFKGAISGSSSDDELDTSAFPAERQKAMQSQPQTPAVAASAPVEQPQPQPTA